MASGIKIFGYGSLINLRSLQETVPGAESVVPVVLKDYIRIFDTESTTRFTNDNTPICVLNIQEDSQNHINGVCFEVSQTYFDAVVEREGAYEAREVTVKSFSSPEEFTAFAFIGKTEKKQDFLFDDPVQKHYLQICLDGAKDFGEDFYQMFLETTQINNKKLVEIPEIAAIITI